MNLTTLPKFYKIFICLILIVNQVNIAIEVGIHNDLTTLRNITEYYHLSPTISMRHRRQSTDDQNCEIPIYPNSALKIINDPEAKQKPGDFVKEYSILEITCNKGYKLPPSTTNGFYCINGQWSNLPPACLRTCPSLMSTTSLSVKCRYNESISLDNCIQPVEGTTVRLSCNTFYEADAINRNPIRSCKRGKWTPTLPECYATCGLKIPKGQSNIINGAIAVPGDYPWQVGVYDNTKMFLCGGSVIDQSIVLSAAHCFADYSGVTYPTSNYLIAAGKYYRQYDDDRDEFPQYSTVRKIFIPHRYKSTSGLNGFDIAIVIMDNPFVLTPVVQPVCIALNEDSQTTNYLINNNGIVTGWGYTQEGSDLSDELKELIIPYVPFDKCYKEVPENFRRFIMFDKICGGYLNEGTSVCQGDSGGGLIYKINNHYFVKGIVSTSPSTTESGVAQCDSHQYGLYTSVNHHIDFVRDLVTSYGFKEFNECANDDCKKMKQTENKNRCRLPSFPHHGRYSFPDKESKYVPGNYIDTTNVILLNCDAGYDTDPKGIIYLVCLDMGKFAPAAVTCKSVNDVQIKDQNNPVNQDQEQDSIYDSKISVFDLDLLQLFNENAVGFAASPPSVKIMLAMLLEGSRGKSAEEISKIIDIPVKKESSHDDDYRTLTSLQKNLLPKFGFTILNVANVVAVSNKYKIRQEYKTTLEEHYTAEVRSLDFSNPAESASAIDSWGKAVSGIRYPTVREDALNDETSLVTINILFFKAIWKTKFSRKETALEDYQTTRELAKVMTMKVKSQFRYGYFEKLNAQVVELPYNDGEFAMSIFLPNETKSPNELQKDLQHTNFSKVIESLNTTYMSISLPKFDIEYTTDLRPTLEMMGIKGIFSEDANLGGIVKDQKIKVDKIIYKVAVTIDENGQTRGTVPGDDIPLTSFIANRPFLFFIYNINSNEIVFEGRLNEPIKFLQG